MLASGVQKCATGFNDMAIVLGYVCGGMAIHVYGCVSCMYALVNDSVCMCV